MNEVVWMVEEGVVSVEDIDIVICIGFGLCFVVFGLFEFIDWGGCDILYYVLMYLVGEIGLCFVLVVSVVCNMEVGCDGVCMGVGFYDYVVVDVFVYMW